MNEKTAGTNNMENIRVVPAMPSFGISEGSWRRINCVFFSLLSLFVLVPGVIIFTWAASGMSLDHVVLSSVMLPATIAVTGDGPNGFLPTFVITAVTGLLSVAQGNPIPRVIVLILSILLLSFSSIVVYDTIRGVMLRYKVHWCRPLYNDMKKDPDIVDENPLL